MKNIPGNKTKILVLGGLSILVLFLLVASLGKLQFKPAKAFAYEQSSGSAPQVVPPTWNGLVYVIIFMAGVLIILFILLPSDQRKKYLIAFGLLTIAGIVILLILSHLSLGKPVLQQQENAGNAIISPVPGPTNTRVPEVIPAVFIPPQVSLWSSFFVALVFILVLAGVGGWVFWSRRKLHAPYESLAEIALSALEEIEAGKDWGDAIVNSYLRMNKAVAEWRGIHRTASMTPAEFAEYLTSTHLPQEAVSQLTTLFERVRYGEKESTPKDIQEAVECLTTILDYCQKAR
ncbi:MAG TPA: DUF4129 domain-containing protein [Anaerolineales bacterium]